MKSCRAGRPLRRCSTRASPFAFAAFGTLSLLAWAHTQNQNSSTPRFSVESHLVRLLVTARDRATNAIVTDLRKEDFAVTDNGTPQVISVFERNTSLPLSIAILIDTSSSTHKDLGYETSSILKLLHVMRQSGNDDDALAVYSFNWQIRMEVGFTRNEQRAERALRLLKGEGGTSLYDAIFLVAGDIADRDGRHVMVVVTDGGDTTSYKRFDDAVKAAIRADTMLYPVVVVPIETDAGRNTGGEHALEAMTKATGGRAFYPAGASQLDQAFADILKELRTQYLVGFYPRGVRSSPGQFHKVGVTTPRTDLMLTTRTGYYDP